MNRARAFANRVRELPGLRIYPAAAAAAALIATAAGAFGTDEIAFLPRLFFWSLMIGANTIAWVCWFGWRVRQPSDWWPAALVGAILLNLPIPLEVAILIRLVGPDPSVVWSSTWLHAAVISAAILLVLTSSEAFRRNQVMDVQKGKIWRAGYRSPEQLAAVLAEDHYCRLVGRDGTSKLVHARFSDLLNEVADLDGAIVRRGHWVAADSVSAVARDGRRWVVALRGGEAIRVASSCVADLRGRGWIA